MITDLSKIENLITRLEEIIDCSTPQRFPFWNMEERPKLMADEIEELIRDLKKDEDLVIS